MKDRENLRRLIFNNDGILKITDIFIIDVLLYLLGNLISFLLISIVIISFLILFFVVCSMFVYFIKEDSEFPDILLILSSIPADIILVLLGIDKYKDLKEDYKNY